MNPFTESTVARPLSEPRRRAANEGAVPEPQEASRRLRPGAGGASRHAKGRRLVRNPRSLRLARRRAAGAMAMLATTLALGVSAAWAVNVNSAGAQELETITGIGPKTAQTIVEERNRGGSFESFEDLSERVKGIGPKKAKSLQAAGLVVGPGGSTPKAPAPAVQRKAGK